MKKIVLLISFFVISLCINFRNVNAYTLSKPASILRGNSLNSKLDNVPILHSTNAWGYENYATDYFRSTSGGFSNNYYFGYNNLNLCSGGSAILTGHYVTWSGYNPGPFNGNPAVYLEDRDNSVYNRCSTITSNNGNVIQFICYTEKANNINFNIQLQDVGYVNGNGNWSTYIGLATDLDVQCDVTPQDVVNAVNSAITNSQNAIINNQTQNKNEIIDNQNQNQAQTNQKLDELQKEQEETNDFLTDDTPPNADISGLGNVSGLLPPGPLDSLLNIPFQFLSILTSSMSGTCVPLTGDFVWGSKITLPCFDEIIYGKVNSTLMNFISLIPASFILINYFKHLYKKVERAVSLETTSDDEWGCI